MIEWLVNDALWDIMKKSAMAFASKDGEKERGWSVRITCVWADIWNRNLYSMEHINLYSVKNTNWSLDRVIRSRESWPDTCDLGLFLVLHHSSKIYIILGGEWWRNSTIKWLQYKANWIK